MKKSLLNISIALLLYSCDQMTDNTNSIVTYSQLTPERNYWDSIPGKIKVRDKNRPYRYYLNGSLYTGKIEDYFGPGRPKLIGAFKDGYADGLWKYYQNNDSLDHSDSFANGYVTGEWRFYDRHGRVDTRLMYYSFHDKHSYIKADTLYVRYDDGSQKELRNDSIYIYYSNGNIKSRVTTDGSAGREWDKNQNMIAETKDYVTFNNVDHQTTYYIAHGKHINAYKQLLDKHQWTDKQKESFKKADKVKLSSSKLLNNGFGFEVRID